MLDDMNASLAKAQPGIENASPRRIAKDLGQYLLVAGTPVAIDPIVVEIDEHFGSLEPEDSFDQIEWNSRCTKRIEKQHEGLATTDVVRKRGKQLVKTIIKRRIKQPELKSRMEIKFADAIGEVFEGTAVGFKECAEDSRSLERWPSKRRIGRSDCCDR